MGKCLDGMLKGVICVCLSGLSMFNIGCEGSSKKEKKLLKEYEESQRLIVGTVLSESYNNELVSSPVRIESKYVLKIKTTDGRVMGLFVLDNSDSTKEALDQLVEVGSRISFPRGNLYLKKYDGRLTGLREDFYETYVKDDTQIVTKRADRIRVLELESSE